MRRDEEAKRAAEEAELERERRIQAGEDPDAPPPAPASTAAAGEGTSAEPMDGVEGASGAGTPHAPSSPVDGSKPPPKKKPKKDGLSTPGGGGGSSTPLPKPKKAPGSTARGLSEQAQKRVSNSVALQSAGIARKSWMFAGNTAGAASPSPASRLQAAGKKVEGGRPSSGLAGGAEGDATPSTPAGPSSWAKPFLSSTTSTPLLPPTSAPSALNADGTPSSSSSALAPGALLPAGSHAAQAQADALPHQPVGVRDVLWVLERERQAEGGEGRGGVGRVLRRARAGGEMRGWD